MKLPTGTPCVECPWRRAALPGWLGPYASDEWLALAHSDEPVACHLTVGRRAVALTSCSGAAIYRRNVAKAPRGLDAHQLPADRDTVFANRAEFAAHHDRPARSGPQTVLR